MKQSFRHALPSIQTLRIEMSGFVTPFAKGMNPSVRSPEWYMATISSPYDILRMDLVTNWKF